MKVKELIELLATAPPDAEVIYACYSDFSVLTAQDIRMQRRTDALVEGSFIAHHNMPNQFRRHSSREYGDDMPPPKPLDMVIFPGN